MAVKTIPQRTEPHPRVRPQGAAPRWVPRLKTVLVAAAAYVVALLFLFPYVVMLLTSLRAQDSLREVTFWPEEWVWSNLANFWTSGLAGNLWVTIKVAGGSTILVLLVALPAAYYSARHRFRGRTAFLILVLITQMFQPTAMLVGIYREFYQFGLVDSVWSLILVNVAFQLGFCTFVLSTDMKTLPKELYESAQVDGASVLRQFFQLTLPLCRPPLAALATLEVTWIYNEFFWATVLLQSGDKFPITSSLNNLRGQFFTDNNLVAAGSVLVALPVLVVFFALQKQFVSGLTLGATKG